MQRKVLITGANGLLGQYLLQQFSAEDFDVVATGKGAARMRPASWTYVPLDITDAIAVTDLVLKERPDIIIHAAAITQVDQAEINPIECWNVNVTATRFLLDAAKAVNAYFLYVSTDFVFSGNDGPYDETALPDPVNYYGSSKLAAEKAVMDYPGEWCIVRTVLVLGNAIEGTRSTLASWVLNALKTHQPIKVVSDQLRTPTLVHDLARGILLAAQQKAQGIFHISGKDAASPYEIAVFIAKRHHLDQILITPVTEKEFTQPAKRPRETIFVIEKAKRELGYAPQSLWDFL
ncbi:SDR family oxidoreductase [Parasegetibacter sp. NRK P23]|uniref:SDR family oxidoreductase n=1 Tax=Parasegetibacter sp. NRK P23 TaxID=2942999 RepID=UPI002043720C|nr:SDR family oxidoreductase [Parasegetibacter sp. NRK P23]MCM5528452.1 SDR family oxidoreductase [Parasegetibacter sp. NRK P23]